MASVNPALSGLALTLVKHGLLAEEQAQSALDDSARHSNMPFVSYLVTRGILKSPEIASIASREFGVPLLDLSAFRADQQALKWADEKGIEKKIDEKLIITHHVFPLYKRDNRLFLAVSDPTQHHAFDAIRFNTGLATEIVLVEEDKLARLIDSVIESTSRISFGNRQGSEATSAPASGNTVQKPQADTPGSDNEETSIVDFVYKILLDAVRKGVSDIHFEPYEEEYRIRYRKDGLLYEASSQPVSLISRITARIKVLARLDVAEYRVPQDGRIKFDLPTGRSVDFRVNTCPTLFGEKIVLRILDPATARIGIEKLGFEPEQQKAFLDAIHKPYGMILVTGPTGSGKTVSLYTGLNILNDRDRNISTVEDPVEITVPGINQVNVNPRTGLTFAEALRAFLRQDPDVIMVGEIRDLETAEIAVKAAQTGHMVLSTLHTNDAPQTLNRLMQMGIPAFNIATSVVLIMAQRLARRLCTKCRKPLELPPEALMQAGFQEDELGTFTLYGPGDGCSSCARGYSGRVGIYQVMPISDAISRLILEAASATHIAEQAHLEGIADIRQSGLKKVKAGITSLTEIDRVTRG